MIIRNEIKKAFISNKEANYDADYAGLNPKTITNLVKVYWSVPVIRVYYLKFIADMLGLNRYKLINYHDEGGN